LPATIKTALPVDPLPRTVIFIGRKKAQETQGRKEEHYIKALVSFVPFCGLNREARAVDVEAVEIS
jgi:hypothetical protein